MTQPSFVPITEADQVRPSLRLSVSEGWTADRPAELQIPVRPQGRSHGTPGPDQGFALSLARRFEDKLVLAPSEVADDVLVGCAMVASRRSALFGRAPSVYDLELALGLWGFCDPNAPAELVERRTEAFRSAPHHYTVQRSIVDSVPEATLRLTPAEVRDRAADWPNLLGLAAPAEPAAEH